MTDRCQRRQKEMRYLETLLICLTFDLFSCVASQKPKNQPRPSLLLRRKGGRARSKNSTKARLAHGGEGGAFSGIKYCVLSGAFGLRITLVR